ncbi:hypothetical protein PoB_007081200 [Plakobranchus ocellatus]|uniref:Secreted protein n=1 Tax=Plakobranchus ocellatus TaxID=259542 RepID=A0AAV4DJ62_9GAST|nr:hypothetical protein PoB_007081200 [Plakobranchus ocellatus]
MASHHSTASGVGSLWHPPTLFMHWYWIVATQAFSSERILSQPASRSDSYQRLRSGRPCPLFCRDAHEDTKDAWTEDNRVRRGDGVVTLGARGQRDLQHHQSQRPFSCFVESSSHEKKGLRKHQHLAGATKSGTSSHCHLEKDTSL